MAGAAPMRGGVLGRRRVAASDVAAGGAPAQVQPPTADRLAVGTAGTAGWYGHVHAEGIFHARHGSTLSGDRPAFSVATAVGAGLGLVGGALARPRRRATAA
jgi:hypothetical protein